MEVIILREAGHQEALLGLSLSYDQPIDRMSDVARKLAGRDNGENKFLESIAVWLDVTAPRYWWAQADTYRVGVTKQSASTMHTILRRPLAQGDFERPLPEDTLAKLNALIDARNFDDLKNQLPEGFLQRRIVCTNYKALRHMIAQRHDHRLREWHFFCEAALSQVEHPEFLADVI